MRKCLSFWKNHNFTNYEYMRIYGLVLSRQFVICYHIMPERLSNDAEGLSDDLYRKDHEEDIRKNKKILGDLKKLPDDAQVLFRYQYKYRPQLSEELYSAKKAASMLEHWLENGLADMHDLEVEILSEEQAREHKNGKEKENEEERKEAQTISISKDDLEDIALWAQMGEGSIVNMNDPDGAKQMLREIWRKARKLLDETE